MRSPDVERERIALREDEARLLNDVHEHPGDRGPELTGRHAAGPGNVGFDDNGTRVPICLHESDRVEEQPCPGGDDLLRRLVGEFEELGFLKTPQIAWAALSAVLGHRTQDDICERAGIPVRTLQRVLAELRGRN